MTYDISRSLPRRLPTGSKKIGKGLTPLFCAFALGILAVPGSAQAVLLGFDNISANNVGNAAIGETQLTVEVTDAGTELVSFLFSNSGPEESSITDVYFDDGSLLGIASIIDADDGSGGDPGVDFSQLAIPGNLPSANNASPPFETTAGFSADSDSPVQPNGVNPDESLKIIFNLQTGQTFSNVEDELTSGDLRIGIHVQGFASGGSESFVNNPPSPGPVPGPSVPEPGPLALIGLGGLMLGWMHRRRRT
jgi:hypothetical protein